MEAQKSPDLPPLPELPVIRDTYCSQEMTDVLVRHLQEERPDLIAELVRQERRGLPDGHDDLHGKRYGDVIEYLRAQAGDSFHVPPTRIGMLDLLYELSRRIRKALNLQEIPVFGKPLAPGPEGPFPPLVQQPVRVVKNPEHQLPQELVDRVVHAAYEQAPNIFYDFAEQMRRLMRSYEISQAFYGLIKKSLPGGQEDPWNITLGSAHSRLHEMCEMPDYETLKKGLNHD